MNKKNNTGRRGLSEEQIDLIIKTYKETKSIARTATITGFNSITVNKYVLHISSKSKYSRNNVRTVICSNGKEYRNPHVAAKELGIDYTGIIKCLNGEISSSSGYNFKYK